LLFYKKYANQFSMSNVVVKTALCVCWTIAVPNSKDGNSSTKRYNVDFGEKETRRSASQQKGRDNPVQTSR